MKTKDLERGKAKRGGRAKLAKTGSDIKSPSVYDDNRWMQVVEVEEGPAPWMRWLAIPAAFLIITMVALAINTESRSDFITRVETERAQGEAFEDVDATRIVIMTENGAVELSLDGETVLGRDGEGDVQVLALRPDPDGDIVGFRVNDDGTFEPVRIGEDTDGATLIVPNDQGGFDLVSPDGTRTSLDIDGEGDLRAFDEDGNEVALAPNGAGGFDLGDGITGNEANVNGVQNGEPGNFDPNNPDEALPSNPNNQGGDTRINWRNIIIVTLGLLGLAGTVWWFFAMKPNRTTYLPPATAPAGTGFGRTASAWELFEAYLSELAANPDPTQAIRLAYGYAEQGMGRLQPRDPEQTPQEWYRTVAMSEPEVARLLWPLTERYSAIRFGNHVATDAERHAALNELRAIVHNACADDHAPVG